MRHARAKERTFLGAAVSLVLALSLATGCTALESSLGGGSGTGTTSDATESTASSSTPTASSTAAPTMTTPDVSAAARAISPSVVLITVTQDSRGMGGPQSSSGNGSGIIIRQDGYILTNNHVVEGANSIVVTVDGTDHDATVVGTDAATDLAVVKIDKSGLNPAEIGNSSKLEVGQWVIAVGFPYDLDETVTLGIVSGLGRTTLKSSQSEVTAYTNLIQTDAAINPGNSGGALADLDGRVVGVNALIESDTGENTGIGFAIPIDFAMDVADQLLTKGRAQHAFLGVGVSTATTGRGAAVESVEQGSPAASAGMVAGDIITRIGDMKITDASDVFTAIRSHQPGQSVVIQFTRGGATKTVTVTLAGRTSG